MPEGSQFIFSHPTVRSGCLHVCLCLVGGFAKVNHMLLCCSDPSAKHGSLRAYPAFLFMSTFFILNKTHFLPLVSKLED